MPTDATSPPSGDRPIDEPPAIQQAPAKPARERDLLITFLRGWGMVPVLILHWVMDYWSAPPNPEASLAARSAIPWFLWLIGTWVIPGFFFATGATSWRSLGRTATRPWLWARLKRVLVPYYVLAAILAGAELFAGFAGVGRCQGFGLGQLLTWIIPFPHYDCLTLPSVPLWYVTAFVFVTLVTPLLYRIMKNRWAVMVAAVVAIAGLTWSGFVLSSLLRDLTTGVITAGSSIEATPLQYVAFFAGHAIAWPAFTMLGFAYGRGTLQRHGRLLVLVGVVLTVVGFVPMATGLVPVDIVGNLQPPSLTTLIAGGGALLIWIGIRDWLAQAMRALHMVRPLDAIARRSYTVYLWHMPVYAAVWWAAAEVGLLDKQFALEHPLGRNVLVSLVALPLLFPVVRYMFRFETPGAVGEFFRGAGRIFRRRRKPEQADANV